MNRKQCVYFMLLIAAMLLAACGGASESVQEIEMPSDTTRRDAVVEQVVVEEIAEEAYSEPAQPVVSATRPRSESDSAEMAEDDSGLNETYEVVVQANEAMAEPEPIVPEQRVDPSGMTFDETIVNPFTLAIDDNLSTFAIDVDTGSYTLMRNYLSDYGSMPPAESVRVEEYVNFFDQAYAPPATPEDAFAIHIDGAPSPYAVNDKYHLVRVGIQGYAVPEDERPPVLLIFVIDTSGSMDRADRLGLVKDSLELLVNELRPDDRIGIIEYGSNADIILSPTNVRDRWDIVDAIDGLRSGGSTNAEEGIMNGYRMANRYRLDGEVTRLIVLSDGVANVGNTTAEAILDHARRGVSLSTYGFGMGNYNDALMEQLADQGDGSYAYIDTLREAQRVFVTDLTGTLVTIAKDAKIQVNFNTDIVQQYRLIGYENRDVADSDFRNDAVDAGEIGSGHSVTALYEVRLGEGIDETQPALTVHIRYENPETGNVRELARAFSPIQLADTFEESEPTFQLSAVVAEYAEVLRDSYWAQTNSLTTVWQDAERIGRMFPSSSDVAEFVDLVETAAAYSK